MRSFLTSLLAFFLSLFIGGLVVQVLAEKTGGTEEWLVPFGLVILVTGAVTMVFFVEQLAFGTRTAARVTALILTAIFVLVAGLLIWASFALTTGPAKPSQNAPLIAGIVLPGLAIILVQWLIVRWRTPLQETAPPMPRFGRGGQVS